MKQFQRKNKNTTPDAAQQQGEADALEAFRVCVELLERSMTKLNVTMPPYAKVSGGYVPLIAHLITTLAVFLLVDPGYEGDLSSLAAITRDVVQDKLKNDAWLMWAIAQRVSLPVKIDACIEYVASFFSNLIPSPSVFMHIAKASAVGVVGARFCQIADFIYLDYYLALSGAVPGLVGRALLRECLARVHKDIVDCWNLKNGDQVSESWKEIHGSETSNNASRS